MSIPARYTPEILNMLQRAGLAEARAGRQGGYRLRRPPQEISFLQVVEASEGVLHSQRCVMSGGPCHWQQTVCAAHPMLDEARRALTTVLDRRTLADVLKMDEMLLTNYGTPDEAAEAPA